MSFLLKETTKTLKCLVHEQESNLQPRDLLTGTLTTWLCCLTGTTKTGTTIKLKFKGSKDLRYFKLCFLHAVVDISPDCTFLRELCLIQQKIKIIIVFLNFGQHLIFILEHIMFYEKPKPSK